MAAEDLQVNGPPVLHVELRGIPRTPDEPCALYCAFREDAQRRLLRAFVSDLRSARPHAAVSRQRDPAGSNSRHFEKAARVLSFAKPQSGTRSVQPRGGSQT